MSIEKAIRIVTIFDENGIYKISKRSFNFALNNISRYIDPKFASIISEKSEELIKWISNEIILARANDIYDSLSEEEMDYILEQIANPTMLKLIHTLTTPSDAFNLKTASLDIELIKKFIDVVKESDKSMAESIENSLKEVISTNTSNKKMLN